MSTPKYTLYIVSRAHDHHYPVIMANNGKACLNEPVKRIGNLMDSAERFLSAAVDGTDGVRLERIKEAEFRERFPSFAPNAGARKGKAKPKTFKRGEKVVVNAGVWGEVNGTIIGKGKHAGNWKVRVTSGAHSGHTGAWSASDITKA